MDTRPSTAVLKRLPLTPAQQTELSDAFMAAQSPEEFAGFLESYQLHAQVKRSLADAAQFTRPSFAGAEGISAVPWYDREAPGTRISARDVLNLLPAIGGTVGGIVGAAGGPLAAAGLSGLAAAGGESGDTADREPCHRC